MGLNDVDLSSLDLDQPAPSQEVFGALVGIRQQHVSRLIAAGVLVEGATLREWVSAYTQRLRDVAADRARQSSPGLQFERLLLLRARVEGLRMSNDARRAELAPVAAMDAALAKTGARIAPILTAIPPALRAELPVLGCGSAGYAAVVAIVAKAVAEVQSMRRETNEYDEDGDDGDDSDA